MGKISGQRPSSTPHVAQSAHVKQSGKISKRLQELSALTKGFVLHGRGKDLLGAGAHEFSKEAPPISEQVSKAATGQ
jgi:hypothetical protein